MKSQFSSILFILLFVVSFSSMAFGQKNRFREGKVTFANGETQTGWIKNLGELERSRLLVFKTAENADPVNYYPKDISKYSLGQFEVYRSGSIQMKGADDNISVFFKVLVDGDVLDLLQLNYQLRPEESPFYQLTNKFYVFKATDQNRSLLLDKESTENYIDQLPVYLEDCGEVISDLRKSNYKFSDRGLIAFTQDYNACRSGQSTVMFDLSPRERKIKFIGMAGVTSGKIDPRRLDYLEFGYSPALRPNIAFLADVPIYQGLSIRGGLNYISRKVTGERTVVVSDAFDNAGEVLELDATFSFNHIAVPVMFVYTVPLKSVRPYMLGGLSFGVAIGNTGEGTRTNFMGFPGPPPQVLTFIEDIPAYSASIAEFDLAWRVGAGIEYPLNNQLDLLLEVLYIASKNDSSPDSQFFFTTKSIVISGGVQF
ncbi:MAG: outer membrane beta-barrel protein [Bacteroidota bacterium]